MSEENQENEHDVQKEKDEIERLGVTSTWNLLSESKPKKNTEEKKEFKGFQ